MRLGIVMMGMGAHAAAACGVLEELEHRHIEPCAVCGMQWGAWLAALHASGLHAGAMEDALSFAGRHGGRILGMERTAHSVLLGRGDAISSGRRLEKILIAQAGQTALPLCQRAALFPLRTARTGRRVVFSTCAYPQEAGAMMTMQASLSFAARAAMAAPPLLSPVRWMGSQLLPMEDAAFACRQLLSLGAQRVLVIMPQLSPRTEMDALDLAGRMMGRAENALPMEAAVLRVPMDDGISALSFQKMPACIEAGRRAAREGLDGMFERLGMAFCRILPFRCARA